MRSGSIHEGVAVKSVGMERLGCDRGTSVVHVETDHRGLAASEIGRQHERRSPVVVEESKVDLRLCMIPVIWGPNSTIVRPPRVANPIVLLSTNPSTEAEKDRTCLVAEAGKVQTISRPS